MKKLILLSFLLLLLHSEVQSQVIEKNGYVVIEMESTKSPLGEWKKIQKGDATFIPEASGGVHLEFTGNNPSSGPANSPLEYTFKINNPGIYHLMIRGSKRLDGAEGDKCNDSFVRIEGDYTSPYIGDPKELPDYKGLSTNQKIFGGLAHPAMGWATTLDYLGHIKKKPRYVFKAGQTYKIIFSGRAQRWNPDFFILYNESMLTTDDAQQISPTGKIALLPKKEKVPTEKVAVVPAIPVVSDPNCWTKGFSDTWDLSKPEDYKAIGAIEVPKKGFQINTVKQPHNEWATAKTIYDGVSGVFNLIFTSLLETDGECYYKVLINGKTVLEYQNPRIHGTENKEYTPYVVGVKNIKLEKGDTIQVDFKSNSNGLVPEKGDFGWARARWKSISIGNCESVIVDSWIKGESKGNVKKKK